MSSLIQRSFAGGEIAPALHARADTSKYATALRTLRNMFVARHGGAFNRPGGKFVGEVKDSSKTVRLIPFVFNEDQTYVLEFGDNYMRVIQDGAYITEAAQNITAITNANPCVLTYSGADNYANGDEVYISGIVGPIGAYLNGRNFKVANRNTGNNTFELQYMDGTAVNSTSFGAYTSGGTVAEVHTVVTSIDEEQLAEMQYIQSADVLTLFHPDMIPYEISRISDTSWSVDAWDESQDETERPTGVAGSAGGAGSNTYRYMVTSVDRSTGVESFVGLGTEKTITGAITTDKITTTANHLLENGDYVVVDLGDDSPFSWRDFAVNKINATDFSLVGETLGNVNAGGRKIYHASVAIRSAAAPTSSAPHVITWSTSILLGREGDAAIGGGNTYNIYKEVDGIFGFIGSSRHPTFSDTGITPDTTKTPPIFRRTILSGDTGTYPSTGAYFQQRLFHAGADDTPDSTYGSKIGEFKNFGVHFPIQDDDGITFTLFGSQVNRIRHLLNLKRLALLTTAGEWIAEGGDAGVLTPSTLNLRQHSYHGSSPRQPLVIGDNALFVQARGSIVRDLAYDMESDSYKGNDLTIFSAHLVDGYEIVDWAYQQVPHSIIWAVRDDGVLLSLTYVREQQVFGWARHDTDGYVENVCVIPEGTEDAVYLTVRRTIDGRTVRYTERMASRRVDDIVDSIFMDCALSYDGRNTSGSHTMDLSGGTTWDYSEVLTLTSSAAFFSSSDVGNEIFLDDVDDDGNVLERIRCRITGYTSSTVVSVMPNRLVPVGLRSPTANWAKAVDEVSGLWHLEGQEVAVFADGFVVASPYNAAYETVTVEDGAIALSRPYSVIHVGLPFISDLETLDIDLPQGETLVDKMKVVSKVTMHVEKTRGVFVGPQPPSDDDEDPLESLVEVKVRNAEGYDQPVELATGKIDVIIEPNWNSNGRVFIRQVDPLPMAILAVTAAGMVPVRG